MKVNSWKIIVMLTFLLVTQIAFSTEREVKVPPLSSSAKASLLTVGRADHEIYQNFGHTAIRIKDSILGWDFVYNYGTFDFGEPNFLYNFIKGKLLYFESIDNYADFEAMYREENRWIREQSLNLTQEQKQLLFERLTINAREENKYYKYDFLFDNCSTRPRDVLFSLFKKREYKPDADDNATYRQLIDRNVPNEWLDFGMDLLIGLPTDKKAKYGRTFLPDELMQLCDSATVDGKPLVNTNYIILEAIPEYQSPNWITPGLIFWLLFVLIFILQIKYAVFSKNKLIPVVYFSILGLLGWLFLFMWFGTEHLTTKWNLNILWAMPFNVPLMLFAFKKDTPRWLISYTKFYRILLITLLIGWWINPQTYHAAVIPLVLIGILFTSILLPIPTKNDFKKRWFGAN